MSSVTPVQSHHTDLHLRIQLSILTRKGEAGVETDIEKRGSARQVESARQTGRVRQRDSQRKTDRMEET